MMWPAKDIVDDVRYEEWHRREVMHAAFEGPVGSAKDEGCDSVLQSKSALFQSIDKDRTLS